MKIVTIRIVCNAHKVLDNTEVEVTEGHALTLNFGQGNREVHLCGCQNNRTWAEMVQVYDLADTKEVPKSAPQTANTEQRGKGVAKQRGDYPCRFCPKLMTNGIARGTHEFKHHPWQRLLWEQQNGIVVKHDSKETRQKRMALLEPFGLTLEDAAEIEREHPHKVTRYGNMHDTVDILQDYLLDHQIPMINKTAPSVA